MSLGTSLMHLISLHRFLSLDLQVPAPHPSSARHLATPTAPPFSAVQGATGHPAVHMQGLWTCPAYIPSVLLFLWPPPSAYQSRVPHVLCHIPSRCQRPPVWNNPQITVCTTLTIILFSFLQMGLFRVDQEIFDPTRHLCVQDVTTSFTAQAELQYVTNHLKVSKTDPFRQGIDVISGCSGTQVCRACLAWDLIQSRWAKQACGRLPYSAIPLGCLDSHSPEA